MTEAKYNPESCEKCRYFSALENACCYNGRTRCIKDEQFPSASQNSDCISRQKVIDMLNDIDAEVNDGCGYMYEHWMDYIKQLSSVTSQPKTGHWIDDDTLCHSWRCNQCYWLMRSNRTNFCPNCGADMRGDENG